MRTAGVTFGLGRMLLILHALDGSIVPRGAGEPCEALPASFGAGEVNGAAPGTTRSQAASVARVGQP